MRIHELAEPFVYKGESSFGDEFLQTGAALKFRDEPAAGNWSKVARELGVESVLRLRQVHSSACLAAPCSEASLKISHIERADWGTLVEPFEPADACFMLRSDLRQEVALSVRTADCLPVLFLSSDVVAVAHAGWKGLALGLLPKLAEHFASSKELEIFIGPHAGASVYEVGAEVIEALGETAVSKASASREKFFLDLEGTARKQIAAALSGKFHFHSASRCTMSDTKLHSYRRDKPDSDLNVLFLKPSHS